MGLARYRVGKGWYRPIWQMCISSSLAGIASNARFDQIIKKRHTQKKKKWLTQTSLLLRTEKSQCITVIKKNSSQNILHFMLSGNCKRFSHSAVPVVVRLLTVTAVMTPESNLSVLYQHTHERVQEASC